MVNSDVPGGEWWALDAALTAAEASLGLWEVPDQTSPTSQYHEQHGTSPAQSIDIQTATLRYAYLTKWSENLQLERTQVFLHILELKRTTYNDELYWFLNKDRSQNWILLKGENNVVEYTLTVEGTSKSKKNDSYEYRCMNHLCNSIES